MLHHSATGPGMTVEDIRREHVRLNGWLDIGYHYVLVRGADGHGYLKAGRPDSMDGAHAGAGAVDRVTGLGWNREALGLCVVGYFHPGSPLSEHMSAMLFGDLTAAVRHVMTKYGIRADHLLRHRDVRATACPGDWFPWERLKSQVLSPGS
jgi:hypothetical protein